MADAVVLDPMYNIAKVAKAPLSTTDAVVLDPM